MQITKKEISVIVLIVLFAFLRYLFFLPDVLPYENAVGKVVEVDGEIIDAPDYRDTGTRVVLRPENQESNILVVVDKNTDINYGDKIKVKGVLETPENFNTDNGREFNYKNYLANKDIYFIIKDAQVEFISSGNGSYIKTQLFKLRYKFTQQINSLFTRPESDLASGLLLGLKGNFDKERREEFVTTGTIHIIALSGYNVTIVAQACMKFFGIFLSSFLSIILGGIMIVLFVVLSGASGTAIRAGIMVCIALFARLTGRSYDAGRGLVVAGLLMLAYDPRFIFDISFQLSFMATFGLIFITPKIIHYFAFLPLRFQVRENAATTTACTIAVLPILLYSTGVFSFVSIFANILVLSFIPYTMLFASIAVFFNFIFHIIALPFAYIAHLLLSYILYVIHLFSSLPFASTNITQFPLIIVFISYGIIFYWVFNKNIFRN